VLAGNIAKRPLHSPFVGSDADEVEKRPHIFTLTGEKDFDADPTRRGFGVCRRRFDDLGGPRRELAVLVDARVEIDADDMVAVAMVAEHQTNASFSP
jgi:hypothetical protein